MHASRRPVRLAAAISSILATPAVVSGFALGTALLASPMAVAQETTTQMVGMIVGPGAKPIAGATVTVLHVPSGTTAVSMTNPEGRFSLSGLRVGGPYRVSARAEGYDPGAMENIFTTLAVRASITLELKPTEQLAEVQVTATAEREQAIGVGRDFSAQTVKELPSISRDVKDVVRIDPKAIVDPSNVDALEIAGTNNRYNSLTVDGVRQNDDFGLNNNGYPTSRSPVSLDAVQAVSVLTAPYDVQYSGFQGGTINIVTKSGTNEFHGSAYYYKNDDGMVGDKSKDSTYSFTFEEETYGATFGGPIIQDKLFFFLNYEKLDRKTPQEYGPTGSSYPIQIPGVSVADYNRVLQISRDVYKFDPMELQDSLPERDEKVLAKIDWNISDSHRLSLAYQQTEGNNIIDSFSSTSFRSLSSPSNDYDRGINLKSYSLQVFSDWNDWLSTELKLGRKEVEGLQEPLNGGDFAEMRIGTTITQNNVTTPCVVATTNCLNTTPTTFRSGASSIYIGPDESRHANYLTNDVNLAKLKADFFMGNHTITAGVEYEDVKIFNLFVQRSEGQYYFNSIDDFAARRASSLIYQNAVSNNENDAAAAFGFSQTGLYVQDTWQVTPEFQLQFGLRYDFYSSSDTPKQNPYFKQRYGFTNTETLDGRDLVSPRLGFNWQVDDAMRLRGGIGVFGGGTPNVWISNSYSNDGVTVVQQTITGGALAPALTVNDGYNIPQIVQANQVNALVGGGGNTNAIDPNFKVPSSVRSNLGLDYDFGNDFRLSTDIMYTKVRQAAVWDDYRLVRSGTAPDGRPIYTRFAGTASGNDLVLTNSSEGKGVVWTLDLNKTWRTKAGRFDVYFGYGRQNVDDVNSGTSSTALSNWDNVQTEDPNNPALSNSNYEIQHRFPLSITWRKALFGDYETNIGLFAEHRSGRHYSFTFGAGTTIFGDPRQASRQRQLLYVPLVNDPKVVYFDMTAADMDAWIARNGVESYRGQIIPRNAMTSPWYTTADMRFTQEIPTGIKGTRGVLSLDIENVLNLINSDWGRFEQVPFGYSSPVLNATRIDAQGRYVYSPLTTGGQPADPRFVANALTSVWRIQLGVRFEF